MTMDKDGVGMRVSGLEIEGGGSGVCRTGTKLASSVVRPSTWQ